MATGVLLAALAWSILLGSAQAGPVNQPGTGNSRPIPPITGASAALGRPDRPLPSIAGASGARPVFWPLLEVWKPPEHTADERWIEVDLSQQLVVAHEGANPLRYFVVSSGLPRTPTVTGTFRIWAKTPVQDMEGGSRAAGDYYFLPDVRWVQYFYADYSFHGTYWHDNFGQPMSHGCVNMTNDDARWLFDWTRPAVAEGSRWVTSSAANPGTLVIVHE